jgi:bacillithiol system protein YtxJ
MYEQISTIEQADDHIAADTPTFIMKHSAACPVSAWALQEFKKYVQAHPDQPAGLVTVQHARDVSNHIAHRLGIRHETPQILLVQDGKTLWSGSHGDVTAQNMHEALTEKS